MGVPDITLKKYFSDKARLADIFNYYCFDGEEAIQPDEVTLRDSDESIAITNDEDVYEVVERIRDILAVAEKNGTMFVLLGVENQEYIHYGMPVRNMIYDALTYTRQMEEKIKINREEKKLNSKNFFSGIRKGEKLIPVVTLVLYLGKEPWDGPRQLSDMLDMDQVPEKMRRYVQSQYQLNLLELRKINDYDRFRTDIKKVLALTACGNDKTQMMKLIEEDKGYRNLSNDAADAIVAMTSSEELKGVINKYDDMKGGTDMCQAIKDLIADGEARGKALGEKHAREQGIQIFILDNLEENIPHDRIQMKLQRRYNLTSELATYYIKEYGVR